MGDQRSGYTIDEALSTVGFGTFQGLALLFGGFASIAEAMVINLLSFIGPAVKSEWSLSPTEESLLSTAVFGGMLFGAYFWGFFSDAYGRRMGIQCVVIVMAGAGLLSAFSPSYMWLVILRCLLGFGAVGTHVLGTWFMEFISTSNRGSWVLGMISFFILGELLGASLAWIVMPRLGWRWLLALSSTPSILSVLFSIFVPETPRYLFAKGRTSEAFKVLEKIAITNRKELPSGTLISDQIVELDEENCPTEETSLLTSSTTKKRSNLKTTFELFSLKLLRTTLLLFLLYFGFTFAFYGVVLMISTLSSGQGDCSSTSSHSKLANGGSSLYLNVFITCSADLPGLILATILVEKIGRKLTMEALSILSVVLLLPLCFHPNEMVTMPLLFGTRMLVFGAISTLTIYVKEVYPTSLRAAGSGLATAVGRIGGMVCPLVAVGLVRECLQTLAVTMVGVVILISGVGVLFCPVETKGKELTDINASTTK